MSEWADAVLHACISAFAPLTDPERAVAMRAYMKDVAPFLGIPASPRRSAQRDAWQRLGRPRTADLAEAASALWELPEREYAYAACDLLAWWAPRVCRSAAFLLDPVERLLVSASWWDTVDGLRSAAVGPLARRHRDAARPIVDGWSESGDRWLVRIAITHQIGWRADTDADRLFALCARHGDDREFFVAKAIGWALRDYARTAPDAVRAFAAGNALQPLSVREALRNLAARADPAEA